MPCILIDFDGRRQCYNMADQPVPWQQVVNVYVGKAPTVDVFFKSDTQEIHVKTFKFKTQKDRRVSVTVNVDATNTVTAKLVTLEDFDKNGSKDETIVMLHLNGTAAAYTRTDLLSLSPLTSIGGSSGEQYDEAVSTAALAVPPSQASAVFIVPNTANHKYAVRKRMVEALETAGYSNVCCVEQYSSLLSNVLKLAKPNKQVGEYVGIGEYGGIGKLIMVHVVQKTGHGYDFVETVDSMERLRQSFPTIKEIISMLFAGLDDDKQKTSHHLYRPLPVKVVTIGMDYVTPYAWNKLDGGNMDGYLVTMPVQCKFRINYKGKNTVIDARTELLPWQKTIELDIGDAMTLDIFMHHEDVFGINGEVHVKQFKFTSKKSRKVSISIAIDDARLPEVKLTTL